MAKDFDKATSLGREVLWEGNVGSFGIEDVALPNGRRTKLAVLAHPGAAAVLPLFDDERVLLLRQYRHAVGRTLWEVPAGKLDAHEAPERCARRELEEETGYRAGRIEPLGWIYTTPGFTDEVIHLFAAHELTPGRMALEADETLQPEVVRLQDALRWVDEGHIVDAKSVCTLFHALRHLRRS